MLCFSRESTLFNLPDSSGEENPECCENMLGDKTAENANMIAQASITAGML